ncbi:collagen alpha-1(XXV) chain isoform X7 [Arapaima gigas]
MEQGAKDPQARRDRCSTSASVLSVALSVAAVAVCVLLSARTSEVRARLAELERAHRAGPSHLDALVRERVEELLSQQRSYEHLAKIRAARQAPPDCTCPPDPQVTLCDSSKTAGRSDATGDWEENSQSGTAKQAALCSILQGGTFGFVLSSVRTGRARATRDAFDKAGTAAVRSVPETGSVPLASLGNVRLVLSQHRVVKKGRRLGQIPILWEWHQKEGGGLAAAASGVSACSSCCHSDPSMAMVPSVTSQAARGILGVGVVVFGPGGGTAERRIEKDPTVYWRDSPRGVRTRGHRFNDVPRVPVFCPRAKGRVTTRPRSARRDWVTHQLPAHIHRPGPCQGCRRCQRNLSQNVLDLMQEQVFLLTPRCRISAPLIPPVPMSAVTRKLQKDLPACVTPEVTAKE